MTGIVVKKTVVKETVVMRSVVMDTELVEYVSVAKVVSSVVWGTVDGT